MALDRATLEAMFRQAVVACDPAQTVRAHLQARPVHGRRSFGIAIGKAALAMARGAGPVFRGVCVSHALDGKPLPTGWVAIEAAHPVPDLRSLAAADAVCDLVAAAYPEDEVLALISGGASALIERPVAGLSLEQFVSEVQAVAASGAAIHELNAARIARSQLKGGKLAARSAAPVYTLVASDVFDDDLRVVGSGPTVGTPGRPQDRVELVIPVRRFVDAWFVGQPIDRLREPLTGTIDACVEQLLRYSRPVLAWGEPVVRLPPDHGDHGDHGDHSDHGIGGRAQQLALALARALRGRKGYALVVGSDGMDGPAPLDRPAPAGAYVTSATWDAIRAAGLDPEVALARCDAGPALAAVGALVVTGPTGINHGDVIVLGVL